MTLIKSWVRSRSLAFGLTFCLGLGMGLMPAAAAPVTWQMYEYNDVLDDNAPAGDATEWQTTALHYLSAKVFFRSTGPVASAVLFFTRTVASRPSSFSGALRTADGTADLTFSGRYEDGYPPQWQVAVKDLQDKIVGNGWVANTPNNGATLTLKASDKDPNRLWLYTPDKTVNCLGSPGAQFVELDGENVTVMLKEPAEAAISALPPPSPRPGGKDRAPSGVSLWTWFIGILVVVVLLTSIIAVRVLFQGEGRAGGRRWPAPIPHDRKDFKLPPLPPPPGGATVIADAAPTQPPVKQSAAAVPLARVQRPGEPGTQIGIVQTLQRLEQTVEEMKRGVKTIYDTQQTLKTGNETLATEVGKLREDVRKWGGTKKQLQDLKERMVRIEQILERRLSQVGDGPRAGQGRPEVRPEPAAPTPPEAAKPAPKEPLAIPPPVRREARPVAPKPQEPEPITEDDLLPSDR